MTVVDNGPTGLVELAGKDPRVARELAAAERERIAALQRRGDQDAATQRRLAEQEGRLRLAEQRDQLKANRAGRRQAEQDRERAARRARRQARRQARAAWLDARVAYVRDNAAAVYSAIIYGLAVSGAVYGQVDAARANNLPTPVGVIAAIAIEGTGLAMALTAQQQRLKGERAIAARSLVWICTAAAVSINAIGHHADPVKAIGLSFLSALGIVVYEVRSGAKHRKALRELGVIPEPPERFGWRRWLTYPRPTWAAWRLDVRDRLSPGAAALIARAEQAAAARRERAARREQTRRREQLVAEVAGAARKAARAATKKGDAGAALAALVQLSHTGTPAPLLALPSPARAEAEAARRALAEAEAVAAKAVARAEAEATARTEAEATVAAVRAEAEAAVAVARAEAEAARATAAEAEANMTGSGRKLRAETSARAEAEATAHTATQRAEAEAVRAARAEGAAEAAERVVAGLRRQLADEQQRLVQAEARAVAAEQVVAGERQNLDRVDRQHRQAAATAAAQLAEANEQVTTLQAQLAEAEAALARRGRRSSSTAAAAAPAEPVLFHGKPVPAVTGAGPDTVLKVLTAYEASPAATKKELATAAGTTDRTVRAVLSAASDLVSVGKQNNEEKETGQ